MSFLEHVLRPSSVMFLLSCMLCLRPGDALTFPRFFFHSFSERATFERLRLTGPIRTADPCFFRLNCAVEREFRECQLVIPIMCIGLDVHQLQLAR